MGAGLNALSVRLSAAPMAAEADGDRELSE
jgi:hypothetical protein